MVPAAWQQSGTLVAAQQATGKDFALYRPATITGTVYNDINANSAQDAGEAGLSGWQVYLDRDGNGSYSAGDTAVTSSADGSYSIGSLLPGTYALRVTNRAGWTIVSPALGSVGVTIGSAGLVAQGFGAARAPNSLTLTGSSVAENQPTATTVGTLTATDDDPGSIFSFTLVPGASDNSSFQIPVGTNTLQTNAAFDFETRNSFTVQVRVTDQGGLSLTKSLSVSVTNVNEPPTGVTLSGTFIAENLPSGTVVGTLSTTDPDVGETYTYEVLAGPDSAAFAVAGSQLKTASMLNYEAKASYSITVRVHDGSILFDQPVTISVSNVNESPTAVRLSAATVGEGWAVGTVVGALSTTDPDGGETYSYDILPGPDASAFAVAGSQITTAAVLDYDAKAAYTITVRVQDGSNTFDQPLTIAVARVTASGTSIPELALDGD